MTLGHRRQRERVDKDNEEGKMGRLEKERVRKRARERREEERETLSEIKRER